MRLDGLDFMVKVRIAKKNAFGDDADREDGSADTQSLRKSLQ